MKKLSRSRRAKLILPADRIRFERMSDDEVLAYHDLTHEIMERRSGSHKRQDFAAPLPSQEAGE